MMMFTSQKSSATPVVQQQQPFTGHNNA